MNIKGHQRGYESLSSNGADRAQRGGTVTCSCGWSKSARSRKHGVELHDAHKADVASGSYTVAVNAEIDRRLAMYRELLDSPAELKRRHLTAAQVQGWMDDLCSGYTKVSVQR